MNIESIVEEIKKIIEEIADISQNEIGEDASMIDDLDLSSLETMAVISEVERRYSIKISETEMLSIGTVKELAETVKKSLKE